MVKIENEYGDKYTGKYSNAIYQQHYGRQIRRKGYKQRKPPSKKQIETRERFKEAIQNIKQLPYDQVQSIKKIFRILKEKNPRSWPVNWYNFAKLCYIKTPKVTILDPETFEYQVTYFSIYQVVEKTASGLIVYDSGIISSPETNQFLQTYQKTPETRTKYIEITVIPGITHTHPLRPILTSLKYFDNRYFDNRYFT
ncbi:hypothetical protein KO465_01385 [Candidatus Micrarchaeota archaeon]|jgi:hypothetical protein|nr:hypothetical protein [Candidatus Micrarchaeota archaeon]